MELSFDPSARSDCRPKEWPILLLLGCVLAGCPSRESSVPNASANETSKSTVLTGEPEPAAAGFKPLKPNCSEPVVRMVFGTLPRTDAGALEDSVRPFVAANRDFASPQVNYALGGAENEPVLLARCPDPDTANRLVRKLRERARDVRATPVCGYVLSGWASARRTVELP
jgi:hypothetical protein